MGESDIFRNEFLRLLVDSDQIYIETFKKGFPLEQISSILSQHPEIGITSFSVLRNSINFAPRNPEKVGELKERITIDITANDTIATIIFNISKDELDIRNRENLIKETFALLSKKDIVFGINKDIFKGELECGKSYMIAQGTQPINGTDAIIRMYVLQDIKPEVRDDGRVDFYELKLINRVQAGTWLGERIEATEGYPGQTVKGVMIKPVKGKTIALNYDKNTIQEIYDNKKTTLFARINGAVSYTNGRISVSNHLEIDGDVGISTGNIKFEGYLTVKGAVCDGFSVEATKDIEINSELGLGSVKSIVSTGGSVYIKGGISPKSKVEIKAAKNVFIKFVDNANITCGGIAHIGYYCLNSNINAKEVILDASNGQIIGGYIKAEIKVVSPIIGSEIERKTTIEVTGFVRPALVEALDSMFHKISDVKNEQQKMKNLIASFDGAAQMNQFQRKDYNDANDKLYNIRDQIKNLEEERKNIAEYLKAHGEGEIAATKRIHPNSTIIIKNIIMEITSTSLATTFYIQDGEIKLL
jgi:uncharacterized protein